LSDVTRRLPVTTYILPRVEDMLIQISKRSRRERETEEKKSGHYIPILTKSNVPAYFIEKFIQGSTSLEDIIRLVVSRKDSDLERVPVTVYVLPSTLQKAESLSKGSKDREETYSVSRIFSLIIESNEEVIKDYDRLKKEVSEYVEICRS